MQLPSKSPIHEKRLHRLVVICCGGIAAYSLYQVYLAFPALFSFWNFPYDWNPGDGDGVALARRIFFGQAIYGDWFKGEFLTLVTPLYYYAVSGLDWVFEFNGAHGRQLNLCLFALCLLAMRSLVPFRKKTGSFVPWLAPLLFLTPAALLWPVVWIAPDVLCFSFSILCLVLATRSEFKFQIAVVALCSVLAVDSQQGGLVTATGLALYYFLKSRKEGLNYVFFCTVFGAASVGIFEHLNNQSFVMNAFFNAGTVFWLARSSITWTHSLAEVKELYFSAALPVLVLAGIEATSVFKKKRIDPVTVVWAVQTCFIFMKSSESSEAHIWTQWMLTCVLAVKTISWNFEEARLPRVGALFTVCLSLFLTPPVVMPHPSDRQIYAEEKKTAQLKILSTSEGDKQFLFDQNSTSVVLNGSFPPIIPRTAYLGYESRQVNVFPIVEKIQDKDFALITTSGYLESIPSVMDAIKSSYVPSPYWSEILGGDRGNVTAWEPKPIARQNVEGAARGVCGENCDSN